MTVIANCTFPEAGVWMLGFMILFAIVLLPIFPFILRRRRRKEQAELHRKIEEAKEKILEDGIVEGPKGPRVPHKPWNVGGTGRTRTDGPPKGNAYHGGPWA
jgi:flagellar biosynthesis/type III secretory pathway M-ring protein FliF/YscJ